MCITLHIKIRHRVTSVTYEFVSIGGKGEIRKLVVFEETDLPDFYNLGFGDKTGDDRLIDDWVITDNGDSGKVLATIAAIVSDFTARYPGAKVFAVGSTPSRTRLYRIALSNNLDWMETQFDVFGFCNTGWEAFRKSGDYEAFYVVRKL